MDSVKETLESKFKASFRVMDEATKKKCKEAIEKIAKLMECQPRMDREAFLRLISRKNVYIGILAADPLEASIYKRDKSGEMVYLLTIQGIHFVANGGNPQRTISEAVRTKKRGCPVLTWGIDLEWSGKSAALCDGDVFFRRIMNDSISGYDGAGRRLWELRTKPSKTVYEQLKQIKALSDVIVKLENELAYCNLISKLFQKELGEYPQGCHIHIHRHVQLNGEWPKMQAIAREWNNTPGIKERTKVRTKNGYGRLDDRRPMHSEIVSKCPRGCTGIDYSFEWRALTAPDLSNQEQVAAFGRMMLDLEQVVSSGGTSNV